MDSPFGPMRVIVNPRAGRGAVDRGWPAARTVLDEAGLTYEPVVTERAGHATEAARDAVRQGIRFVVAVGGDGTIHEVVNGLMGRDGPLDRELVLGVVSAGSGCDFVKTFGIPKEPAEGARHLLGDSLWGRLDVGRVTHRGRDGRETFRWFPNIAEAGLGAEVVAIASKMPKWLGGSVYRLAAARGLMRHKQAEVKVKMHGRKARGTRPDAPLEDLVFDGRASMIVVANCQFYGGGMRVAPRAIPSDGLLDALIFHGPKSDVMKTSPKMFKGEHVPHRNIAEYLVNSLTIEGDRPVLIEADGEVIGTTPASFSVVPEALRLKI